MIEQLAEFVLRAIGVFYAVTVPLVIRAVGVSALADVALAALSGEERSRAARAREMWIAAGAVVNGVGGLALALLIDWAMPIFVFATVQQFVYLEYVAPRLLDPYDEPEAAGRRSTVNAAIGYAIVSIAVVLAYWKGMLLPWQALPQWLMAAAGLLVLGTVAWASSVLLPIWRK